MSIFKRVSIKSTSLETLKQVDRLTLYERYGSMAYGVILHIIPEPELAQTILIDVFASLSAKSCAEAPTAGDIIRSARTKALAARPASTGLVLDSTLLPTTNDTITTAEIVFNLSFREGCSREEIAERLNLSPANVLKAFRAYFNEFRSS